MNGTNNILYLSMGFIYPVLLFVLFFAVGLMGESVPFSLEAFVQPYLGEQNIVPLVLLFIALFDLFWYNMSLLPRFLQNKKSHLIAVVFPEVIAVFGFLIGFLELNPWAAIPFFVVAFINYVYAYMKVSQPG